MTDRYYVDDSLVDEGIDVYVVFDSQEKDQDGCDVEVDSFTSLTLAEVFTSELNKRDMKYDI